MKKFLQVSFFAVILFGIYSAAYADPIIVNLTVRDGGTIVFSGAVPLQPAGMISLNDTGGTLHSLNTDSVLSVLNDADIFSADFSISNLTYDNSYNSFYLKCMTSSVGNDCDNWQYTVNNSYPAVGMDKNVLVGGENVYIYFGPQYKVLLSSNSVTTVDNLNVTSEEYNYQDNTWKIRTGVTVGLTQPDPNNPWTPIEVKTGAVNGEGKATFSSVPVGSYNVGIKEDFYFPTEPLTVNPIPATGGVHFFSKPIFDEPNAVSYLKSMQAADGSFGGSDMYTDWAAIAYAAADVSGSPRDSLLSYMNTHATLGITLTDNERHVMALLALGQNPYSFHDINYIKAITDNFDGIQFGDSSLTNDDIFALIPLFSAGYTASDDLIAKDIKFILAKQLSDGSWEGSVDLTSAAIQALKSFDSIDGVSNVLTKASAYLSGAQGSSGGWGSNVSSTSWAMQAMNALGANWTQNGNNALDFLATEQATDGAVLIYSESLQNRIWATSYAIPAVLGKSWSMILHPVSKPTQDKKFETLANLAAQNVAAPIMAANNTPVKEKAPEPAQKKSWLRRFFDKIFSLI